MTLEPFAAANTDYSVLMAVYAGDQADWVEVALRSMEEQSVPPSETVIVRDGPVNDSVEAVLGRRASAPSTKLVVLSENQGLANALTQGLVHCTMPLVARMDADDVAVPERMERQLGRFRTDPGLAMVGSWYDQFDEGLRRCVGTRRVPERHEEIRRMANTRTPINHPTIVFRREAAMAVGGYGGAALYFEDWWLTWRLISAGFRIANLPESLVKVRGGEGFAGRRHGLRYARHEWDSIWGLRRERHFSIFGALRATFVRIPPRFLPRGLLQATYERLLR